VWTGLDSCDSEWGIVTGSCELILTAVSIKYGEFFEWLISRRALLHGVSYHTLLLSSYRKGRTCSTNGRDQKYLRNVCREILSEETTRKT
jgi:hypothetical protein